MGKRFCEFQGEKVRHTILGEGEIVKVDDQYIYISFAGKSDKISHFKFPDIFFDGRKLLSTEATNLFAYLKKIEVEHTCSRCSKKSDKIKSKGYLRLCEVCIPKMQKCDVCQFYFEREDYKEIHGGEVVCPDCIAEKCFICSDCGEIHYIDNKAVVAFASKSEDLCLNCVEWKYKSCWKCGQYVPEDVLKEVECSWLCPACVDKYVVSCESCGESTTTDFSGAKKLCYSCESELLYKEFINDLQFSRMISQTESFEQFKRKKTRKIMSRLRRSYGENPAKHDEAPIDVLFLDCASMTLMILWDIPSRYKSLAQYGCTLTELKRDGLIYIRKYNRAEESWIKEVDGRKICIWKRPYELRAQMRSDMDFGDRWEGPDLVYEGNKYGDASRFMIIGYIIKELK